MNVLFGTHQLVDYAGSELFTSELARSVQARGHHVAVFTFFKGNLSDHLEAAGIRVFDTGDSEELSRFTPDIVQTNHITCAHYLRTIFPGAVRVHAILGVVPNLEAPPLDAGAYSLGLAVSEEAAARISGSAFGRSVDVAIFRNWFDDAAVAISNPARVGRPIRAVVISNHIAPELVDALNSLETDGEVAVDYFGMQRQPVRVDGSLLAKYDLVISIGRTVLLAAACGVPCIMADIYGSDGVLTVENLDDARTVNFSGRLKRQPINPGHLRSEIGRLASFDREALRKRISAEYRLSMRIDWLLSQYETLREKRAAAASEDASLSAPGEGLVYAEMVDEIKRLRIELRNAGRRDGRTIARLRSFVATLLRLR